MSKVLIDRAFLRVDAGLIHYRHTGNPGMANLPLVMAHGGPGCSAGLAPLISAVGSDRMVVAPDMMGNGDSDRPPTNDPSIEFYAECILKLMDSLGLHRVDLYGHHTGAQVACEVAIAVPDRVRRIVLDGVGLFPADVRAEYLERYAPAISPTADGRHLSWVWEFLSETTQHFPHYLRDSAHRIQGGAPLAPNLLTDRAAEVLKVWSTYHLAYKAAFRHDLSASLSKVGSRTLVLAINGDPLASYADMAAKILPNAEVLAISRDQRASAIASFLTDVDPMSSTLSGV